MRKAFRGFYSDDHKLEEIFASENVCFIFDTSVLLNMYQFKDETRTEFFDLLEKIQGKIWIPYHVALEYQRNRVGVISREKRRFSQVENKIEDIKKLFKEIKDDELLKRIPKLNEHAQTCEAELNAAFGKYKAQLTNWNKKQPEVRSNDNIRKRITELFDGRVGDKPDEPWLKAVQKEGEERFKHDIPPGYCDKKKEKDKGKKPTFKYAELTYERKFGDLIAWKQIIKFVSEDSEIKEVVFITDDGKEDWLYTINSHGKKTVGVRSELREEICEFGEIEHFSLVNSSQFLELASKVFGVTVAPDSISDITERVLPKGYTKLNKLHELIDKISFNSAATQALDKIQHNASYYDKITYDTKYLRDYFDSYELVNKRFHSIDKKMIDKVFDKKYMEESLRQVLKEREIMKADINTLMSSPEFKSALQANVERRLQETCLDYVEKSLRDVYDDFPMDQLLRYAINLVETFEEF